MIKRNLPLALFIFFLLLFIFFIYKDYGVPWDEKVFFNTGKYFVVQLFNTLKIPTNLSAEGFVPTPYHLQGHGVFMDMLTVFAGLVFPNFTFETLHLIRALFAIPIFILLYWIVSRLLSKAYGLIAVLFLLLFPRFFPEIFYNAVDVPTTLLFTLSLAYFLYYKSTKQAVLKSIIFGLILGITINQRLLLFYLPLLNFMFFFFLQRRNLKLFFVHQGIICISLLLSLHLTHPYLLAHPITGLFEIISHAKQYPWNAAVLFEGQFFQTGIKPLPWHYLPKTMIITIPLITLLLLLVGTFRIIYNIINPKNVKTALSTPRGNNASIWLYILSIFYFPFILVFALKPTLYDSWRQFLFLTIPIIIIATFGLDFLLRLKIGNWKLGFVCNLVIGLLMIIGLLTTTIQMIGLHPYQYLYYNSLVGGLKGAFGKYETDYWGLGYKDAVLWFNKNINNSQRSYKIFVEGDPLSSTFYFKPNMRLTTNLTEADYIITFTRWNFHDRHPGKVIYTIEREKVPLIFVKQLL